MKIETYPERINRVLRPSASRSPLVVDLFAGCGGLSLGFEAAGFEVTGYEKQQAACATYHRNLTGQCVQGVLDACSELPAAEVVIGGPPCQPFSVGGSQRGLKDSRDGFPVFVSAVRRLKPEIFLFENVRGMLYRNKAYLDEILAELGGLGYTVEMRLLNAVRFGVPQNRERLVVTGCRAKRQRQWLWPVGSEQAVTAGEALGGTVFAAPAESRFLTPSMDRYIAKYEAASKCARPRDLRLEAPSRTVTCRNLAGATGDMLRIRLKDGRRRMLLLREAARLQSFPDWWEFEGTHMEQASQIGNAVAPLFALSLAQAVRACLGFANAATETAKSPKNTAAILENCGSAWQEAA